MIFTKRTEPVTGAATAAVAAVSVRTPRNVGRALVILSGARGNITITAL